MKKLAWMPIALMTALSIAPVAQAQDRSADREAIEELIEPGIEPGAGHVGPE
jgi:hypothetical protein